MNTGHHRTIAAAFFFLLRLFSFFRLRLGLLARARTHVCIANRASGIDASGNAFFRTVTNGGFLGLPVLHALQKVGFVHLV